MGTSHIRCAVIGCGRIGSSLQDDRLREKPASHAGAIAQNRETVLVAGADPDAEARHAFGRRWRLPASALYETAEKMLKAESPDIVHIASDTDSHIPLLRTCLAVHIPVIILEKPVGESLKQAQAALPLVQAAQNAGTSRVIVNHERRFSADYRELRSIISSEELGILKAIHARLYMGKTKKPADVLWHDGTHLVDLVSFLAGHWEVNAVHGDSNSTTDPFFSLGKTTGRNETALITIDSSPGRDFLAFELDCEFASGRVRAGNGIWEVWKSEPSPFYEQFRSLRRIKNGRRGKTGYFANMLAHAVSCFYNPATPSISTFEDGVAALEILQTMCSGKPQY